ncbi:ACT domain-containing protein [Arthrobacter sp. MMS18-M83]|uniref:ACT domain-containing protein n=1 Tax=Arthrobacter sp. MMS18-M83 TaxID=2996261 RepID=UPI002DD42239|nr:ACT domain-containing protein [Arthrobacter sp. MMS18-M83]
MNTLAVNTELPFAVKVLVLTVATSLLGIWVAEPSVRRLLRGWLHAPALRHRRRLTEAPALWRARTYLDDQPGALERVTGALAHRGVNILSIHVHLLQDGVLDELILSAPDGLTERRLLAALQSGGGRESRVWPTTALALADGQTRALSLAAHLVANTDELPLTVAEHLGATVLTDAPQRPGQPTAEIPGTVLKIPSSRGPLFFFRAAEPFTPAESARAHRLAELAEVVELTALAKERPAAKART